MIRVVKNGRDSALYQSYHSKRLTLLLLQEWDAYSGGHTRINHFVDFIDHMRLVSTDCYVCLTYLILSSSSVNQCRHIWPSSFSWYAVSKVSTSWVVSDIFADKTFGPKLKLRNPFIYNFFFIIILLSKFVKFSYYFLPHCLVVGH